MIHSEIADIIRRGDADALAASGLLAGLPAEEKDEYARLAARYGCCEMLRRSSLLLHGAQLGPDAQGRTLLHLAAQSGDVETIRFVAERLGFDPLAGDDAGVTPLDLAANDTARRALEELAGVRLNDCYRNPVLRGFRPDPSILRRGDTYYLINSSFVMLPALPISRSRDLVHWEDVGAVFTDPGTAGISGLPGGFGYWAPDISWHRGRFWVVATLRRPTPPLRLQMITSAPSPEGPWDPPKFLPVNGIDPSLFTDDDGRRYMLTNPGVHMVEISETGDLIGEPRLIWYGCSRIKSEGPHLLKKDGWYYLFQAEGGTGEGHHISCARSRNLEGPYTPCPFNPILGARRPMAYIGRGGHGKPVQLPDGRWMMAYLCGRHVQGKTMMGRETALDPIEWTADGWPMVNGLKGPSCLQKKPLPDVPVRREEPWICPRADWRGFARPRDGKIVLTGGAPLSGLDGAHLLLHRQREAGFLQRVTADVSGLAEGGLAGLAGYYDENSFFLFGLRRTRTGAEATLQIRAGTEEREETLGSLPGTRAELTVTGEALSRRAYCAETGEEVSFSAAFLTDEGVALGKRFTGATLGMAAVGEGEAVFAGYCEEEKE